MRIKLFGASIILASVLVSIGHPIHAQDADRQKAIAAITALNQQIKKQADILLAPSPSEIKKYAEFLKKPDTGIMRLLPREKYDTNSGVRGGGAYYSFVLKTNEYGHGTDIGLEQGNLRVGFAGRDFGFFHKLGDVSIDDIDLKKPDLAYMKNFQPTDENIEALRHAQNESRSRVMRNVAGGDMPSPNQVPPKQTDGSNYPRTLPAEANCSYVLRSIARRSDLLVAFRIVSQESDGSVTIIWKKLANFPASANKFSASSPATRVVV